MAPAAATRAWFSSIARAVKQSVERVAARIAAAQSALRPTDVRRKGVGDFVTTIDLRSELELRRDLHALLPEAGFLGEESTPAELGSEWVWVVDPIDGTSNFARGLPHFAVSVALLHRGDPVLGVLHCAPEDAIYVAQRGIGVRRNGRLVRMGRARLDDGAMIGCQWHRGQQQLDFVARLQKGGGRIRTLGSTVTQLADVVMGRLDANVQEQGRIWDFAAAGLCVEEAGGRFTDWTGARVFPLRDLTIGHTATIAASPAVHRRLVRLLGPVPVVSPR